MSDIYQKLQQQQTALESVPGFGDVVRLNKPPSGEDLAEMIYLEPAVQMIEENQRTGVVVEWTAVVMADPWKILERALDAQDSMLVALRSAPCVASAGRVSLGDRQPWARTLPASITITFVSSKLPGD